MKKYEYIIKDITTKIEKGILKVGDKLMTESSMIAYYKVSRITVRQALAILAEQNIIVKTQGSGSFVAPKTMTKQDKNFVALIISNTVKELIKVIEGADAALSTHAINISIFITNGDAAQEKSACEEAVKNGALGVIIFPIREDINEDYFCDLVSSGYPVIFIDRSINSCPCDFVASDSFDGTYKLTNHLIERGHTRLCYITGGTYSVLKHRLNGFIYGITKNGLDIKKQQIYNLPVEVSSFSNYMLAMEDTVSKILKIKEVPTAIIGCNDSVAVAVIKLLKKRGYSIPEDFSIAGFDNSEQARAPYYSLTSVEQDFLSLGRIAGELLYKKLSGLRNYIEKCFIPPRLVTRQSTAIFRIQDGVVK